MSRVLGVGMGGQTLVEEAVELEAWDQSFCSGGAGFWLGHCYSWMND